MFARVAIKHACAMEEEFKLRFKVVAPGKFRIFVFPNFAFSSCFLFLIFYRNINFETKYARGGENGEAKIWAFTGSK